MALMSYKCPNCGGGLVFDPDSQKFQCEYCLSEFTEEEMKRMEEASAFPADEEKAVFDFFRHPMASLVRKVRCVKARRVWKLTWNVGR